MPPRRRTAHDMPFGVPFRFMTRPGSPAYRRVYSPEVGRTWLRALDDNRLVLVVLPLPVYPVDDEPGEED